MTAAGPPPPGPAVRRMAVDAAQRPLRIGVLCSRFPLPTSRADQHTTAHLLAFLHARGHEVDLFCLSEGLPPPELRAWVAGRCHELSVVPQRRWRSAFGALVAPILGLPLQVGWFGDSRLSATVRRAVRQRNYDVLYGYTLRCAEPLRGLGRGRNSSGMDRRPVTYLAMQLSQALNTRRIAEHSTRWRERMIYGLEHRLTSAYESRVWRDFTRTVLIGESDVREVSQECARRGAPVIDNYLLAAHGVDADRYFLPDAEEAPGRLVFSGQMATNTNVNAVLWFVRNVWPRVRRDFPAAEFVVVGRRPVREIQSLHGQQGIAVTGEVDDPARYLANAAVCVNPMQAGAGMQNKLLEYFAAGKAVVATSVANEGIGAKPGQQVVIADTPADFASAIATLLRDPQLRQRVGSAARYYVLAEWSWESLFLKLEADMVRQLDGANR